MRHLPPCTICHNAVVLSQRVGVDLNAHEPLWTFAQPLWQNGTLLPASSGQDLRPYATVYRDTVASNCSTGNCWSNFNKRISSKNWELWARWGFQPHYIYIYICFIYLHYLSIYLSIYIHIHIYIYMHIYIYIYIYPPFRLTPLRKLAGRLASAMIIILCIIIVISIIIIIITTIIIMIINIHIYIYIYIYIYSYMIIYVVYGCLASAMRMP